MSRNISDLHPRLQQKIAELQQLCKKEGLPLGIGECFRTVAEQDALYAQGRTKPGNIVTNAKGSTYGSQHMFGIAVDFFKNVVGHAYDDIAFFNRVGELAKSIGLGWGGDWTNPVDKPHLYLPDWGKTTSKLKYQYGTPEAFMKTWSTSTTSTTSSTSTKKSSSNKANEIVRKGQIEAVKFTGVNISIDGIVGNETKKMKCIVLQHAMNLDYGNTLKEDGVFGKKSEEKLGVHYVKKSERQYMVTAAEILMMLNGVDPCGVEYPGIYGYGLVNAAKIFFGDNGTKITSSKFLKLIK